MAIARVAVGGHRKAQTSPLDAQHRGVAAGCDHGRVTDHVVVAPKHAAAAGQVGAGQQAQQRSAWIGRRGQGVEVEPVRRLGREADEAPHRRAVGQELDRKTRNLVATVEHCEQPVTRDLADRGGGKVPRFEDALDLTLAAALHDHEHPFLRFRQHHVIGRHASFTPRHSRDVDTGAGPVDAARAFRHGGCQPGRAQVLDRDHGVGVRQIHARLKEAFLEKRIAHLHRRPALRAALVELERGERRAVDAVATSVGTDQNKAVARTLGASAHELVRAHQADAHRVHQRVVRVALLEVDLAADSWNSNAVAVTADTGDHSFEAAAGGGQRAEAQRVQERDRARAHRDHVADDAADAGGRPLVGLYRGGVVVRLDLEDRGPAVADLDRSGVLAGALDHTRSGRRQTAQQRLGALVRAML